MNRFAAAALATAVLAASPARAQAPQGPYVFLNVGAFSPRHEDLEGFGPGFDTELGLGYQLIPYLAVEAAAGHYWSEQRTAVDPVSGLDVPGDGKLSIVPVTGTLRGVLPIGRAEIPALAGIGLYFARLDATIPVAVAPSPDSLYVRWPVSSTDRALGVHLGAGIGVHLMPQILLGADLRYVFARAKFFETETNIGGLRVAAVLGFRF